jgi:homoserine dehydrogenase
VTAFDLVLVGFGNVARRFVTLLRAERAMLAHRHDLTTRIVGITTRRHAQVHSAAGLNGAALVRLVERGRRIGTIPSAPAVGFVRDAVARSAAAARQRRLVVVEATTLDVTRGEPAASHIRAALAGGAHVITANKGPVAADGVRAGVRSGDDRAKGYNRARHSAIARVSASAS